MKCFFSCQTVTYMSGHPPLNIQVLGATQAHSLTHSPKHQTSSWCHPGLLTHPLTQTSYPRDPLSLAYFNLLRSLSSGCACWSGPFLGTQIFTQVLQSMVAWMPRVGKGYMFNIILMARDQSNLEWTTYLAMITKPTKSELQTWFTRTPQVNQCSFSFEFGPRHLFLSWFFSERGSTNPVELHSCQCCSSHPKLADRSIWPKQYCNYTAISNFGATNSQSISKSSFKRCVNNKCPQAWLKLNW